MGIDSEIDSLKLPNTLRVLDDIFRSGNFHALETISGGNRLTASEMERAVIEYGKKLAGLDTDRFTIVLVAHSDPHEWSVDIPIQDANGKGDLTLSLFLKERPDQDDIYGIEITDLHVL